MTTIRPIISAAMIFCWALLSSCTSRPPILTNLPAETAMNRGAGNNDLLWVSLHLADGGELPFILDTGAPTALLDISLASRLRRTLGSHEIISMYGRTQCQYFQAPDIYWGQVRLGTGHQVATMDLSQLARDLTLYTHTNHQVMGILGMDSLWRYCLQLDFQHQKIRFIDPRQMPREELGQAYKLTRTRTGNWQGCPAVTGVRGWPCMIDTGALGQNATNVLGLDFLAQHLVTFDFPGRRMYLKKTVGGNSFGEPCQTQPDQSSTSDFVQGRIKIIPPVHRVADCSVYSDGGTIMCVVQDAAGNFFNIYYDHRIHTPAPGAIYLLAHPNERGSVRVQNEAEFRSKVRYE